MAEFKRSTARDFRINAAVLEEALAQPSSDEDDADCVSVQPGSVCLNEAFYELSG